MLLASP